MLIERTEGNPFFLEESVQTLVETRVLIGERGAYRLARTPEASRSPPPRRRSSPRASTGCRPRRSACSRRPPSSGRTSRSRSSQAIAEQPEDSLRQGLRHLQGAEFLYETSLFPDLEYTFKHALTHEVAYGSLLQERRRVLHARIVEAIEALYPSACPSRSSGSPTTPSAARRGRRPWGTCARRAPGPTAAPPIARPLSSSSRPCTPSSTCRAAASGPSRPSTFGFELRAALFPLGQPDQILECLTEAGRLAETLGDPLRIALVDASMGNYCWWTGQPDRALAHYVRAAEAFDRLGHEHSRSVEVLTSVRPTTRWVTIAGPSSR